MEDKKRLVLKGSDCSILDFGQKKKPHGLNKALTTFEKWCTDVYKYRTIILEEIA